MQVFGIFVRTDEPRTSGEKTYYNVRLLIEGAGETLRFPVDKDVYARMTALKMHQRLKLNLAIDARIQKGNFSASPELKLSGFEVV